MADDAQILHQKAAANPVDEVDDDTASLQDGWNRK